MSKICNTCMFLKFISDKCNGEDYFYSSPKMAAVCLKEENPLKDLNSYWSADRQGMRIIDRNFVDMTTMVDKPGWCPRNKQQEDN